jgi:DNA-directed RNA polymerase subunit F
MKNRKSKQSAMQDYANDEAQRTSERLYSSTMEKVTLDRDYKDVYAYAKALLVADGVKNPSNQQVNDKANEILVANGNIKFKKGTKVQIAVKTADSKFVKDLSNNGFKPTRENAIFYNRFNSLNPEQQQNVLNVIKYCRSQNITDSNKIKAKILEIYPEINLFDSGKIIQMSSTFGTPAFQRKNPVALETFLTETLKLDLKSDVGITVYERLASLPQEELSKINGSILAIYLNQTSTI